MKAQNRFETGTLRDFYPDSAVRHKVHYSFAHRFFPAYVQQNPSRFFAYLFLPHTPNGPMEPTRFIQSRWQMFEENTGLIKVEGDPVNGGMLIHRISDLAMSIHVLADKPVALVQMPSPEQPCEAYFVAAALLASSTATQGWPADARARVFTLESFHHALYPDLPDARERGVFCEWDKSGEHRNFGFSIRVSLEAVLQLIARALQFPDAVVPAGLTPAKDGSPGVIFFSGGGHPAPKPQAVPEPKKPRWKIW